MDEKTKECLLGGSCVGLSLLARLIVLVKTDVVLGTNAVPKMISVLQQHWYEPIGSIIGLILFVVALKIILWEPKEESNPACTQKVEEVILCQP